MKLRQQHHFLFLTYLLTTTSASHLRRRAKNSTQNADLDLDLPPVNVTNSTLSSLETAVDEVKSELAALESSDDSQLNDDEFESKMEQEEELLNEEFALDEEIDELEDEGEAADDLVEEGGWDDDLVGELGGEELEDELEEIEEEIEGMCLLILPYLTQFILHAL
jgi:DNA repair exonuclease SbcCD ATPase subunit